MTDPIADATASEKLINEEYKIWKKNSPFLYDLVVTHALEWPTLTCQWFPDSLGANGSVEQRLLMGTHTSEGVQNHVQIAKVVLPADGVQVDARRVGDGGHGETAARISVVQKINHDGEVNRAR